ncbi:MAG: hypothetical protein ACFFDN_39345 [Candidatus Hodarchaeota archaeon]
MDEVRSLSNIFNVGYMLGKFLNKIETADLNERQKSQRDVKNFVKIKTIDVLDQLEALNEELKRINISEETQKDIEDYKNQIIKKHGKFLEEDETKSTLMLRKITTKIKVKRQKMRNISLEEVKELILNLKMWKDRITIELGKL